MAGIPSEWTLLTAIPADTIVFRNSGDSDITPVESFWNWKKVTYKDRGFSAHTKSESHNNAMLAWTEYKRSATTSSSLLSSLGNKYDKLVKANRKYIKTVAEVLLLTATQNIAQRGHRDTNGNKGNFLAIIELIAKHYVNTTQRNIHRSRDTKWNFGLSCRNVLFIYN